LEPGGPAQDEGDRQSDSGDAVNCDCPSARIIEHCVDGVVVVADSGEVLFANPAASRLLGINTERATVLALSPRNDVAKVELTLGSADGRAVRLEATSSTITWRGASCRIAILRDVTAQRASEARVRSQALMLDVIGQAVVATDVDWRVTYVNRYAEDLFGTRSADIAGKRLEDVLSLATSTGGLDRVSAELKQGNAVSAEGEAVRPDGSRTPVAVTCSALADPGVDKVGFIAVASDLTLGRRVEEALRSSARRFRSMLEHLRLVAVILDADGRVAFCNSSLLDLTEWGREELLGADWFDRMVPEDVREHVEAIYRDAMAKGALPPRFTHEIATRNGARKLIAWSNTVMTERAGDAPAFACVGEDVTDRARAELERRRLEEQLFQVQKMEAIGTLAGGIAHDFNNILAAIMSHGSLVALNSPKDSAVAESIQAIMDSCDRGADLSKQLLNVARGSRREVSAASANAIVEDVLRLIRETFDRAIEIRSDLSDGTWPVKCDMGQIHQTLTNICINARDAMPDGGVLTVSTFNASLDTEYARQHVDVEPGKYVCISVADTGKGMGESVRRRIFDPFFTTKKHGLGTGLGLATSYGIVRNHGGHIQVSSELGKGSVFRVYLPAAEGRVHRAEADPGGESALPRGHETVLFVDDEAAIRKVGATVLKSLGYSVLVASDGVEAVELYRLHMREIGLVITDMVMPRQGGLATVRELRAIDPDCRILVASGFSLNEDVTAALADGAAGYIQKPFTIRALAVAMRDAIGDGASAAVSADDSGD
jgi:PAS domain S-box-containing protein